MRMIEVAGIRIGGKNAPLLIAGPCVIESEAAALRHARELKAISKAAGFSFIYKSSFDKANRTSLGSYRGPGIKNGLKILKKVKSAVKVPVLSDVHCRSEVKEAAKVLDVIQIPAFLCRQTDLIIEAARTGRAVNIKKGQFLAPWDMANVVKKAESAGSRKIIITDRGVSFGYNNLVSDFRAIPIMKELGYPVVYDATHSVQTPGGMGSRSGGDRRFVGYLAMAAAACGADGIFIEAHEAPDRAPSDGPNMVKLSDLESILKKVKRVREAAL
jgi:2-dehydro-3-deoxyphosphooctonate aldolase (KDO 8-P synthase)